MLRSAFHLHSKEEEKGVGPRFLSAVTERAAAAVGEQLHALMELLAAIPDLLLFPREMAPPLFTHTFLPMPAQQCRALQGTHRPPHTPSRPARCPTPHSLAALVLVWATNLMEGGRPLDAAAIPPAMMTTCRKQSTFPAVVPRLAAGVSCPHRDLSRTHRHTRGSDVL